MSFLNPIALWGLLAISIPILIHLWNGKQGKTIAWAAMEFLKVDENQVSKGIKLENWLLLALRILLIVLVVLLLAQLFWKGDSSTQEKKIAHVLTGEKALWEEFRFEIQQAVEKGELVLLADNPIKEISSVEELFDLENTSSSNLQSALDQLPVDFDSLILYLPNSDLVLMNDFYSSPVLPSFQIGKALAEKSKIQMIKTNVNRVFALNEAGILDSVNVAEGENPTFDFSNKPISVLIQNSENESQFIEAALSSITQVYGFQFSIKENMDSADLVFSSTELKNLDPKKLYFFSNRIDYPTSKNQVLFASSLNFDESELIRNGQLPELILESFLKYIGVTQKSTLLNSKQIADRFLLKPKNSNPQKSNLNEWLMALLLGTLMIERYLAFKQGI
ncbi:MAG: BatA domain-containing protein [Algoriphagus sp.]|uniref:BatA domain-containing protein n=1 Tax=Algoriphagus sp. TaxID=1872435 RepID=UPI00261CE5AC|nr:BatA domain-containing protein [Algoriphagus sp.]MDG1277271.1 BatA domain-containing protein [Algoriphagus sp.]